MIVAEFWKGLFGIQSLERGRDYYLRGQVSGIRRDGTLVSATVLGTEPYSVELEWEPDCVGPMTCD